MSLPSLANLSVDRLQSVTSSVEQINPTLNSDWEQVFVWLPEAVERGRVGRSNSIYKQRDYYHIRCKLCDELIRVPKERYPALAARVINAHTESDECVQYTTPCRHRARRVEDMKPSANPARNQLVLSFDRQNNIKLAAHPLGSLIRHVK
jgi:hypothetical protein